MTTTPKETELTEAQESNILEEMGIDPREPGKEEIIHSLIYVQARLTFCMWSTIQESSNFHLLAMTHKP